MAASGFNPELLRGTFLDPNELQKIGLTFTNKNFAEEFLRDVLSLADSRNGEDEERLIREFDQKFSKSDGDGDEWKGIRVRLILSPVDMAGRILRENEVGEKMIKFEIKGNETMYGCVSFKNVVQRKQNYEGCVSITNLTERFGERKNIKWNIIFVSKFVGTISEMREVRQEELDEIRERTLRWINETESGRRIRKPESMMTQGENPQSGSVEIQNRDMDRPGQITRGGNPKSSSAKRKEASPGKGK